MTVQTSENRTELNFALPAIQFSDRHVDGMTENDLSYTETLFLLHCLGNMGSKTGIIAEFTVAELAARFGVKPCNFYGKDGYISRLNATKMVALEIKHHKVCGRVRETPTKRKRNKKYPSRYPLKVGLLHREHLKLLVSKTRKISVLRIFLMMALHTDKTSGALNTVLRPVEWGGLVGGYAHIICNRAVDLLIDLGLLTGQRTYVVKGWLPGVAMAEAFLFLSNEKGKAESEKKKTDADYRRIEVDLLEFFGLNATGWLKSQLREAKRRLLFWMKAEGRKALSDFKQAQENRLGRTASMGVVMSQFA